MRRPAPPDTWRVGSPSARMSKPTHPDTDALAAADADATEGAAYARALLDRIKAGGSNPGELADLVLFLASGSMLHAACAVIFAAIRATTNGSATDGPPTRT